MCRSLFRRRRLRKDASAVETGFLPLGSVRSAVVVVDGAGLRVDGCVEMVERFCRAHKISLKLMYLDLRKFNSKFQPMTELDRTFLRRDMNWFGRPDLRKAALLTAEPVDLYICLYDSDLYCVRYISSCVKARFKVGLRAYPGDPYNFVVSPAETAVSGDKEPAPTDLEALFGKIAELLGKIR